MKVSDIYIYNIQYMIVYFVSKGTVIFCLDKKYGEKEIKEIKKSNIYIYIHYVILLIL